MRKVRIDSLALAADWLENKYGDEESRKLIENLARDLAWTRMLVHSIRHDVDLALTYKSNKGGQQAGVPAFSGAPLSLLLSLERDLGRALEGGHGHVTTAELFRAVKEDENV